MMSLITSSVFIFYLCICSSHACNARRLRLTDNGGGFGKRLLLPSKAFPNMAVNMDSTKKGAEFGDSIGYKSTHGGEMITEKPKGMKFSAEEEEEEEEEAISGSIPIKPIVSVSNSNWHASHNKIGYQDQHVPGFYSDYSRPRTHPPSHN